MSALDMITRKGKTVTLSRQTAGTNSNGRFVAGTPAADVEFKMNIQPITGKELVNRPELQRTKRYVKGYTATLLRTANEKTKVPADLVIDGDTTYQVQRVELWEAENSVIGNFYKVEMAEVNT